jgi:hypothetical protein
VTARVPNTIGVEGVFLDGYTKARNAAVLLGAEHSLAETHPFLLAEIRSRKNHRLLEQKLREHGYT